jgi:Xaa-Pro aminopeptidase
MSPMKLSHLTPESERDRRLGALRAAMGAAGLDALVVAGRGDEFLRGRVQYVSDICQWAGYGYVVIPASGVTSYVGDPLWGTGRAAMAQWITDLRLSPTPGEEVASILSDHGLLSGAIGLVGGADAAAFSHATALQAAIAQAGGSLSDTTDLFDDIRAIKSDVEIDNLRETSAILRHVFAALPAEMRPGVSESAVLAHAHRLARQYGCVDGIALMGRPPHGPFSPGSEEQLRADDSIVIDLEWGGPSGYWLELRRCFSFGPPPDRLRRFWEMRLEVFEACVEAIKPGVPSTDILVARDRVLQAHGYPAVQGMRYTAHGLGVDSLEPPWVPGKDRILEAGMVLSLHPDCEIPDPDEAALYGGISVADNVLVTETGAECLTYWPHEWVTID